VSGLLCRALVVIFSSMGQAVGPVSSLEWCSYGSHFRNKPQSSPTIRVKCYVVGLFFRVGITKCGHQRIDKTSPDLLITPFPLLSPSRLGTMRLRCGTPKANIVNNQRVSNSGN
jgi:hypothetical protein